MLYHLIVRSACSAPGLRGVQIRLRMIVSAVFGVLCIIYSGPDGDQGKVDGDIHGPKPYKFIGFGDIHGPKPYEFMGFGDIHGPKPYKFIGFDAQGPGDTAPGGS